MRRIWLRFAVVLSLALIVLVLMAALYRRLATRWETPNPAGEAELAPGARDAIIRALGAQGLSRVGQVITPGNLPSAESGGTHLRSGVFHGRPYGLAFDIEIANEADADAETRALRLQGIAAWHRGPDAPGGPAGNGPHIHCVWPGAETKNKQNQEQISSFVHGYRALADADRPRADWKDLSIRPDEISAVTHVYARVHGTNTLRRVAPYDGCHRGRT